MEMRRKKQQELQSQRASRGKERQKQQEEERAANAARRLKQLEEKITSANSPTTADSTQKCNEDQGEMIARQQRQQEMQLERKQRAKERQKKEEDIRKQKAEQKLLELEQKMTTNRAQEDASAAAQLKLQELNDKLKARQTASQPDDSDEYWPTEPADHKTEQTKNQRDREVRSNKGGTEEQAKEQALLQAARALQAGSVSRAKVKQHQREAERKTAAQQKLRDLEERLKKKGPLRQMASSKPAWDGASARREGHRGPAEANGRSRPRGAARKLKVTTASDLPPSPSFVAQQAEPAAQYEGGGGGYEGGVWYPYAAPAQQTPPEGMFSRFVRAPFLMSCFRLRCKLGTIRCTSGRGRGSQCGFC
jgi:hypothetical protein